MAVAWVQMATNANTGGSVHHTILLWPFPQMVVAVSFAAASRRLGRAGIPAVAVVTAVMAVSGVLVTNEYHYVAFRYGGAPVWSEAIFPLTDYLKNARFETIYCVDWGFFDSLRLLSHGTLPVAGTDVPVDKMVATPGAVFLAHTKAFENFTGVDDKLVKSAAEIGYRREMITVMSDTYGRPAYEVYRFVR